MAESIRIDLRGEGVLNSKTVYSRNHLQRVVIEKPAWEMEAEERWKRAAEAKEREEDRERQRAALGEGQAVRDEEMMTEEWRARQISNRVRDEKQDQRPNKRCKSEMETTWGQVEEKEEQVKQRNWLMMKEQTCLREPKQQLLLKPWTWLQIEARKVLLELANKVETEAMDRMSEKAKELKEQEPVRKEEYDCDGEQGDSQEELEERNARKRK